MSVENSHHPRGAQNHHGSNPGNVFTLNPNYGNIPNASGLNGAATGNTSKNGNSNELKSHSVNQNQFQGADKKNKSDKTVRLSWQSISFSIWLF